MRRIIIPLIAFLFLGTTLNSMPKTVLPADKETKETKKEVRKARDRYLWLGYGFSFSSVLDQATSPLIYKGFNFANASLGYLIHSDRIISTLELDFAYNNLKSRTSSPWYDPRNTSYIPTIRYNRLFKIKSIKNKVNWYVGPEFNINMNFRVDYKFGNSAFTFDSYAGIGAATRFEIPFSWQGKKVKIWFMKFNRHDRDLRFSWQLSMPLVSMMVRPTYVTITNFIDPDQQSALRQEHITGGVIVPFAIRSQAGLYYTLHNQNMLKLGYVWNFMSHDPGYNKVQTAFHGVQLAFVFKFNNKTLSNKLR
ncbi:MAG: hypothetical protein R2764_04870 [Bacteroidales bacterium]